MVVKTTPTSIICTSIGETDTCGCKSRVETRHVCKKVFNLLILVGIISAVETVGSKNFFHEKGAPIER